MNELPGPRLSMVSVSEWFGCMLVQSLYPNSSIVRAFRHNSNVRCLSPTLADFIAQSHFIFTIVWTLIF